MSADPAPALKEIFDAACFRAIAAKTAAIDPRFDRKKFLALALAGLDDLALMPRMHRMSEALHATLPASYPRALAILRRLAPTIDRGFVTLALCDFVGRYGRDDFDRSLDALKFLTPFGSAEFAVREFLRLDFGRTLAVMETWSRDANEHVRRLASEGSRPRLPWSFRLDALIADPSPTAPILENLRTDPSLYVRKSVANHLNDITKDHPTVVLDRVEGWPLDDPRTRWIARHALRTLIKRGDRRALAVIGAGEPPEVAVHAFSVRPAALPLGGRLTLSLRLESRAPRPQRLVVDYRVHYARRDAGRASSKVFKWKELTLAPGETVPLVKTQVFRDFTTRTHHPGRHDVEILINGESLARDSFELIQ